MRSPRRAALALVPIVALSLAIGACGSDAETAASTSSSTTTTTVVLLAATTSVLPASTAVGQPIPIGQETTVPPTAADGSATTAGGGTTPGGTSAAGGTTVPASPGTSVTGPAGTAGGGGTSPATTTATVPDDDDDLDDPSPNADTAFCRFNAEVEAINAVAVDDAAFIAALRDDLAPRMDQWIADAPNNDLRAAASTMRDATTQVIATDSLDPFDADPAIEALLRITLFCG